MKTTHAIAYVQRKRITDWKRLVLTHRTPAFVYGSNDDYVFAKLPKGSILWIVSSLPQRPPELVARLEVAKVRCRKCPDLGVGQDLLRHFREFKWIAKGTSNSVFFGHNDAGPALMKTVFERSSGETWRLPRSDTGWRPEFGSLLQRPTRIHCPPGRSGKGQRRPLPLEELASRASQAVFISWKWMDHSVDTPLALAHELAKLRMMVWLDHLALPDSRALRKVRKDKDKLERLLRYGYQRCKYLLVVESEHYGCLSCGSAKNWTLRELKGTLAPHARLRLICFRPAGCKPSPHIPATAKRLSRYEPIEAAREFRRLTT
jgi:hypothetical protein